ncbi:MAG: radical SAM protein [Clostridia bacterium]|nr:radical SAM protein [Clostridia bacterium]
MDIIALKRSQLERVAQHRKYLQTAPHLRWLFFEITNRCNLKCAHCGSGCSSEGQDLAIEDVRTTLLSIRDEKPSICLTGGEPLLHKGFFEIAECVRSLGFLWGMTTNATLINEATANSLKQTGMSTVSVSLDGLEASHDSLRRYKGAWRLAVRGLELLQKAGFEPQVTTVIHRNNIDELEKTYEFLKTIGVRSWRPVNIEPIGRACEYDDLMLTPEQFTYLLSFIREKRFDPECGMEVTFGCSHYLGSEHERMVRDHYFLCGAGILTASVRSNGDICACLDIINKPELTQGNIHTDDFWSAWQNRFEVFRRDRTTDCLKCINCPERVICGGDSAHTWDYTNNQPLFCYLDHTCNKK